MTSFELSSHAYRPKIQVQSLSTVEISDPEGSLPFHVSVHQGVVLCSSLRHSNTVSQQLVWLLLLALP